jgi:hypothetical protein
VQDGVTWCVFRGSLAYYAVATTDWEERGDRIAARVSMAHHPQFDESLLSLRAPARFVNATCHQTRTLSLSDNAPNANIFAATLRATRWENAMRQMSRVWFKKTQCANRVKNHALFNNISRCSFVRAIFVHRCNDFWFTIIYGSFILMKLQILVVRIILNGAQREILTKLILRWLLSTHLFRNPF